MDEGIKQLFAQIEADRAARPWYTRTWHRATRRWKRLEQVPSKIVNTYERARYGFGHRDLWSFDHYIAGVISKATKDLADTSHGYPATEEFPTFESWRDFLREISHDLDRYALDSLDDLGITTWDEIDDRFDEISESDYQRYHRGVDAMKRFSENFGSMWD